MKFIPVRLAQSELSQMPVSDGQLIFAYDTGNVYVDTAYGRFQQGISMLSDSSQVPLAPADKLYFNKQTKELLYNGLTINASYGMLKVSIQSDVAALIDRWYLCSNNLVITLPSQHADKDSIKVSTVLDADNVLVIPAAGDTIQSDSGFALNIANSSVEFIWDGAKWIIALLMAPGRTEDLQVVEELPVLGLLKLYYSKEDNKLYYWDGAWREIAGSSSPAGYASYVYGIDYDTSIATAASACHRVVLNLEHDSDSDELRYTTVEQFARMPAHNFKRCVMSDLANRTVAYYLNAADSTKKVDGTQADLTGGDGDVMVEIPICHYRLDTYTDDNSHVHNVYLVSDKPFAGSKIHRFFYTSPGGATARKQYVGAFSDVLCDSNGDIKAQPAENTVAYYTSGDKFRSVAGARPYGGKTRSVFRTGSVLNGGTNVNAMFTQYLMLMMSIDGCTFDTQAGISSGYSDLVAYNYAALRKTGRTAVLGNGTGEILADETETTGEDLDLLTMNSGSTMWGSGVTRKVVAFSYRGIENPYANMVCMLDGAQGYQNATDFTESGYWCTNDTEKYSMCDSPMGAGAQGAVFPSAGFTGAGYAWVSHAFPKSTGFVSEFEPFTFLALSVSGGSSSTYLCDRFAGIDSEGAKLMAQSGGVYMGSFNGGASIGCAVALNYTDINLGCRIAC